MISIEEVDRIAKLSKLSFTGEEKQKLKGELSGILEYVDQLKNINESAQSFVDPDAVNLMRDDVAENPSDPSEFLNQAPSKEGYFVKVKSILE